MPGYEDLSPAQIVYLAKLALVGVTMIMISRVFPAMLQFKTMKYLEVKITTKQCGEEVTPFQRLLSWIKERKNKEDDYYVKRYQK